ncbi:MAG: hypothetical protein AAB150_12785 [Pseudomonadota bacterium]
MLRFCVRARARRLFCHSLSLDSFLRKAARVVFGDSKLGRAFCGFAFCGEQRFGRRLGLLLRKQTPRRRIICADGLFTPPRHFFESYLVQSSAPPRFRLGLNLGLAALFFLHLGRLLGEDPRLRLHHGLCVRLCALLRRVAQSALSVLAPARLIARLLFEPRLFDAGPCRIALESHAFLRFDFEVRQQFPGSGGLRQRTHFVRSKRILHPPLLLDFSEPPFNFCPILVIPCRARLRRGFVGAGRKRRRRRHRFFRRTFN